MKSEQNPQVIRITGTNGKTTVARMIAHISEKAGKTVNLPASQNLIAASEGSAPIKIAANNFLIDSTAEITVLETSCQNITNSGLNCDWADVSVITNIQTDHVAQSEAVENILTIKSLIAARTRRDGAVVLNADDELLARLETDSSDSFNQTIFFSLKPNHITIKRHILSGGTVYTVRGKWLVETTRAGETPIVEIAQIPATLNGFAEFNTANALAAAAAGRALGLEIREIADGLRDFCAVRDNSGRANLFEIDGAYILLDRARNHFAVKTICKTIGTWSDGARRITAIISASANSAVDLIEETGRVAANGFDRIVIRETVNSGLRAPGESAQLLYNAIKAESPNHDCLFIADESEAVRREISRLQQGDILVCFYEDLELVTNILNRCEAVPTLEIKPFIFTSNFGLRHA